MAQLSWHKAGDVCLLCPDVNLVSAIASARSVPAVQEYGMPCHPMLVPRCYMSAPLQMLKVSLQKATAQEKLLQWHLLLKMNGALS